MDNTYWETGTQSASWHCSSTPPDGLWRGLVFEWSPEDVARITVGREPMQHHCRPRNEQTHRICTFDIFLWLALELPTQQQTK